MNLARDIQLFKTLESSYSTDCNIKLNVLHSSANTNLVDILC